MLRGRCSFRFSSSTKDCWWCVRTLRCLSMFLFCRTRAYSLVQPTWQLCQYQLRWHYAPSRSSFGSSAFIDQAVSIPSYAMSVHFFQFVAADSPDCFSCSDCLVKLVCASQVSHSWLRRWSRESSNLSHSGSWRWEGWAESTCWTCCSGNLVFYH